MNGEDKWNEVISGSVSTQIQSATSAQKVEVNVPRNK